MIWNRWFSYCGSLKMCLSIVIIHVTYGVLSKPRQIRSTGDGWLWPNNEKPPQTNQESPANEDQEQHPSLKRVDSDAEILGPRSFYTFLYPSTTTTTTAAPSNNCTCVPYYTCDESQVVSVGGWPCKSNILVCCRRPSPTSAVTTSRPWTTPGPPVTNTAIPGFVPRCGTLNPNGINARILGFKDAETQFGEYPWMAAILEWKFVGGKKAYQFICGGSLIWPSVVITAAHCVNGRKPDHLVVRLGEWDTQSTAEFYQHQDIVGQEVVLHPQYYGGALYYDVALIFLARSAVLAPHIDTICLPKANFANYDNSSCWATGWGKNQFGRNGSYQAILKEVELPITPRSACQTALRKTDLGSGFNLHESFICAGGLTGVDTCVGDGGGPLVCPSKVDPWRYVLAGVISWGIRCGEYGIPGVLVDVKKVRVWIDREISARIPTYDTTRVTIGTAANQYG